MVRVLVTLAYMKGRTDVRTYVRTLYVRTDVDDVMAMKPNFLTSMGHHIFLTMARAELRYYSCNYYYFFFCKMTLLPRGYKI